MESNIVFLDFSNEPESVPVLFEPVEYKGYKRMVMHVPECTIMNNWQHTFIIQEDLKLDELKKTKTLKSGCTLSDRDLIAIYELIKPVLLLLSKQEIYWGDKHDNYVLSFKGREMNIPERKRKDFYRQQEDKYNSALIDLNMVLYVLGLSWEKKE